jgi:hypothetical protein
LAEDLVRRHVAVITAVGTPAAIAATAATTTIPIVFEIGTDPVRLGLVATLNRPGGNVTGVTNVSVEVTPKRLELLQQFLPTASVMALLIDASVATLAATQSRIMQSAARNLGLELHILNASTERDFDAVFANLTQLRAAGLVIGGGPFLVTKQAQLGTRGRARLLAFFRPVYAILHAQCDALKFSCEFIQSFTCRVITHPFGQLARLFRALVPVIGVIDKILRHEISPPSALNQSSRRRGARVLDLDPIRRPAFAERHHGPSGCF